MHVFEDEWRDKRDIVASRLLALLGVYERRVFARDCIVREASPREEKDMLLSCHLQGSCRSKVKLCLEKDGEILALMTFGSRRRALGAKKREGSWEMLRFCCKTGVCVVGGASRLLKAFERKVKPAETVSYADRRWSDGKLYRALGFKLSHVSSPSYWYLDSSCCHRYYRYGFRKSVLASMLDDFDPSKTEQQNMLSNGWHIVWDCGNYVFTKTA